MRRLKQSEVNALVIEMERAAAGPATWGPFYERTASQPARLILALGELTNAGIRGFVGAWKMQGRIETLPITDAYRLNAQGLEGCAAVQTDLGVALMVAQMLPDFRYQIEAEDER